jgi:putative ABC transport system permease protein
VAADSKYRSLVDDSPLLMYVPVRQNFASRAAIVLRTASNPAGMMGPLRREIAALDKSLPLFNVETMAQHLSPALWKQRMAASLIGCFGALALLLATLGLYGVVANSVVQRTHEIGIRMALGAGHGDVLRQVIAEGVGLMVVGVAVGTLGALVLTRFLASLLYGVQPSDPATFALVVLLLAVVGVVASYVPARRATKVDPMVALRYE